MATCASVCSRSRPVRPGKSRVSCRARSPHPHDYGAVLSPLAAESKAFRIYSSSNCHWHRAVQRKSCETFVFLQSARGLAHSKTLRVFQESLCRAQRLGLRRPSAAFPRDMSNCANVNWNCYRCCLNLLRRACGSKRLGHRPNATITTSPTCLFERIPRRPQARAGFSGRLQRSAGPVCPRRRRSQNRRPHE